VDSGVRRNDNCRVSGRGLQQAGVSITLAWRAVLLSHHMPATLLRSLFLLAIAIATAAPLHAQVQSDSAARAKALAEELAKFDNPMPHMARTGPAGTAWDAQYRTFIQTDSAALSKGLPSHAEAARQIKLDASVSAEKLQQHKGWILYIKHFSQAYRPDTATADLKWLFTDIVKMQLSKK
jgi:hypothetical protein